MEKIINNFSTGTSSAEVIPYCEGGPSFSDQAGQDLLLAHLLHAVGIVAHCDRQLVHHLGWQLQTLQTLRVWK